VKILVTWYSRTGTTARVAQQAAHRLREMGHRVTATAIEPAFDLPYPLWLALSFVPRSRFPLAATSIAVSDHDACLLASPKWTFSCPPLSTFLARYGRQLPPTGVLITCGGWDQERYLASLVARLRSLGVAILGEVLLKRREVEGGRFEETLMEFLAACFPKEGP
jgi:hypothetical protein